MGSHVFLGIRLVGLTLSWASMHSCSNAKTATVSGSTRFLPNRYSARVYNRREVSIIIVLHILKVIRHTVVSQGVRHFRC